MVGAAFLRPFLLGLLTLQNTGQTLLIKFAQAHGNHADPLVVMLFSEVLKSVVSFALFLALEAECPFTQYLSPAFVRKSAKLVPTAFLFAVQNQLLFEAIHNLDPPIYQALSQTKILSAGVFSVILLGKQLNPVQWTALLLLACGAALVQVESTLCAAKDSSPSHGNRFRGFVAVLIACSISGLAGCYTELMLKTEKMPMWFQSAQVANASSAILAFAVIYQRTSSGDSDTEFLSGFIPLTWVLVVTIALGGLVVVAVLRLADNVLKGISMVFSLMLSGVASSLLLGTSMGSVFCIASIIICCSVFLYQFTPAPDATRERTTSKIFLEEGKASA